MARVGQILLRNTYKNAATLLRMQFFNTSVSAGWRVPYAVEENLRGMNDRQNERKKDTHSGFLILDCEIFSLSWPWELSISGDCRLKGLQFFTVFSFQNIICLSI